VLDMHHSREPNVPLKPFNPLAHEHSLPILVPLSIPLPLLLLIICMCIDHPQAPGLYNKFPFLNHWPHNVLFCMALFDHVPQLTKELEDDAGHVTPEYDTHLS
jgi:hypothetical protein